MSAAPPPRLRRFIETLSALVAAAPGEAEILRLGAAALKDLIAVDDWLPSSHAAAHPERYQQHLLYRAPSDAFSIVSFVWGPGQTTPVHNHTVWGLIGVLRGAERAQRYQISASGLHPEGDAELLLEGEIDAVSPTVGDIHSVTNAYDDRISISIHVYGADIGKVERAVFAADGTPKPFISGYTDAPAFDLEPVA